MSLPAAGYPRLLALGDAAFTVEFGDGIAPETHARVLGFAAALDTLDMTTRRKTWLDEGWTPFDEEAEKSDEDAYRR